MKKSLILCADDFAQNQTISDGILSCVEHERLTAVSCMTESSLWNKYAKRLLLYKEKIDIGLHLNLTFVFKDKKMTLKQLLIMSHLRLIKPETIRQQLIIQLDKFYDAMGRWPDFIDGHEHVHVFPIIRDILFDEISKRGWHKKIYVRTPLQDNPLSLKTYIIKWAGAGRFANLAKYYQVMTNDSFSGIYDFKQSMQYEKLFLSFLKAIPKKGLIMCHPGLVSHDLEEPLRDSRICEYQFLMSDSFLEMLHQQKITLKRFAKVIY